MTMTKQEWLEIKGKFPIALEVWWNYYKERGGKLETMDEFIAHFSKAINQGMVVSNSQGQLVRITDEGAYRSLCRYYDDMYDIT